MPRYLLAVLWVSFAACTPIGAVRSGVDGTAPGSAQDASDGQTSPDGSDAIAAPDASAPEPVKDVNSACAPEGTRNCAGKQSRQPLRCEGGLWLAQVPCNEEERCETTPGADVGRCVPITRQCIGRGQGEEFCDGNTVLACIDWIATAVRRCGAQQLCVSLGERSSCDCAPGSVDLGNGCQVATSCEMDKGGCDRLTQCSMVGGTRTCSPCPDGYTGDGTQGCTPILSDLVVAGGELKPAFSPNIRSYSVQLPLLRHQLSLTPVGPRDAEIEVDGAKLSSGSTWDSSVLSLGDHPIALVLTGPNGISSRYEIKVGRAGTQEAFIKSRHPDEHDEFGTAVALFGDTLVVGAPNEDGNVGGLNGDEANNAATDSGAVYIYVRKGSSWEQQAYLKAESPSAAEYFGTSVALDGDTLLVGAPRATITAGFDGSANTSREGLVYPFVRSGGVWTPRTPIKAPDGDAGNLFGYRLALTPDMLVISAPYDAESATRSGAIYVTARSDPSSALTKLKAQEPISNSGFGWSIALEGDTLLVGAPELMLSGSNGTGLAYVFGRVNGTWSQRQRLQTSAGLETGSSFGWSIALRGETALVGAPHASLVNVTSRGQVYLFKRSSDRWTSEMVMTAVLPRNNDFFGSSLVLTHGAMLIGASGDWSGAGGFDADASRSDAFGSGAFYLYGFKDERWVRSAYIKASVPGGSAQLAQVATIFEDTVVTGATYDSYATSGINEPPRGNSMGSGAVYVFR